MEDREIIRLFFERSEQAVTELSARYGALCRRIATELLHDRSDAEECVNDTWLAVWDTVPPAEPSPLSSYVCRITRNLALKRLRHNTAAKRNRSPEVALDELSAALTAENTVEEALDAAELSAALSRFLETLDKDTRIMFVRRYWFGDDVSDIAVRFHKTNHYISVRLSRTRSRLKDFLQQEGILP